MQEASLKLQKFSLQEDEYVQALASRVEQLAVVMQLVESISQPFPFIPKTQ